jgi:hypothetical protein
MVNLTNPGAVKDVRKPSRNSAVAIASAGGKKMVGLVLITVAFAPRSPT